MDSPNLEENKNQEIQKVEQIPQVADVQSN